MRTAARRPGYVLIAVLAVVTVLSLAAYRFADGMTGEYTVAARSREAAQAKAFAVSGVHHAAAMLADPSVMTDTFAGNPYDQPSAFSNIPVGPQTGARGGGRFAVLGVGDTFTGTGESRYVVRSGPTDEMGKINLNAWMAVDPTGQTLYTALLTLPNMTEEIADAIIDWMDTDDSQRTNGAESAYYSSLSPPYQARNGPLSTLAELLLVKGVTPQLLYGTDRNRNGKLDPDEATGGDLDRGWSEFLTVYGRELNVDVNGNPRVLVNDANADPNTVSQSLTTAVGQEMSDFVMAARYYGTGGGSTPSGGGSTSGGSATPAATPSSTTSTVTRTTPAVGTTAAGSGSVTVVQKTTVTTPGGDGGGSTPASGGGMATADELRAAVANSLSGGKKPSNQVASFLALASATVTLPVPANSPPNTQAKTYRSPLADSTKMKDLLPKLLDAASVGTAYDMTPRVNVLTAPPEVLAALPGLAQTDADAITAAREGIVSGGNYTTDPAATTAAFLVTQANLTPAKFQALEKYVTGKTMVYRVNSLGYFGRGGPVARVEAVIDVNQGHPRIVHFRDVTDLGRGFDLPR